MQIRPIYIYKSLSIAAFANDKVDQCRYVINFSNSKALSRPYSAKKVYFLGISVCKYNRET